MFLNERLPLFSVALLLKLTRIWASFVTGDVNVIEGGGGVATKRGAVLSAQTERVDRFSARLPPMRRAAVATLGVVVEWLLRPAPGGTPRPLPPPSPAHPPNPSPVRCSLLSSIRSFFFLELDERQRSSRLKLNHPGVEGRRYREIDFKSCPR